MWLKPDAEHAHLTIAADFDEAGELAMNKAAGLKIAGPVRVVFLKKVSIVEYQLDAAVGEYALLGTRQFLSFKAPVAFDKAGEG